MEVSNQNTTKSNQREEDELALLVTEEEIEKLKQCLPKANWMGSNFELLKIQDFWHPTIGFPNILTLQRHFLAQDTDLIVTSFPKTGTTWLKSLLFSIINRSLHHPSQSPLLTHNPHELVADLETGVYGDKSGNPKLPGPLQLIDVPPPRLLHSHLPYASLPESIKTSECKILYICRNPLDTLVSHWHFYPKVIKNLSGFDFQPSDMETFFEEFCEGNVLFGPFFEHVLEYWKQSLKHPNKVLFLKYEDLMENPSFYVKKMAEFVGVPFSSIEEDEGVIEEIVELCSFKKLKEVEVNKNGKLDRFVENKEFFRDGEVGGWRRHLTAPMVDKINMLIEHKFGSTGVVLSLMLSFEEKARDLVFVGLSSCKKLQ